MSNTNETLTRLRMDNEHLRKQTSSLAEEVKDLQAKLKHTEEQRQEWKAQAHALLMKLKIDGEAK